MPRYYADPLSRTNRLFACKAYRRVLLATTLRCSAKLRVLALKAGSVINREEKTRMSARNIARRTAAGIADDPEARLDAGHD
jgi:hypothetical protein